jgi:hypothetical protein
MPTEVTPCVAEHRFNSSCSGSECGSDDHLILHGAMARCHRPIDFPYCQYAGRFQSLAPASALGPILFRGWACWPSLGARLVRRNVEVGPEGDRQFVLNPLNNGVARPTRSWKGSRGAFPPVTRSEPPAPIEGTRRADRKTGRRWKGTRVRTGADRASRPRQ